MNEYEEYLYNYIVEVKFRELTETREYSALRDMYMNAEHDLLTTLNPEQKKLFDSYMNREGAVNTVESQFIFRKALALARTLYLGQAAR